MHYIVDGYNLLFRLFGKGEALQEGREQLLEWLKAKALQLRLTVVFDAQHQEGEATRSDFGPLEIIFSNVGETADTRILALLKAGSRAERKVIVTSDKRLALEARHLGAKTETAEEFLAWLNNRFQNRLKRAKREAKPIAQTRVETPPVAEKPKKRKKPGKNATFAECFEYYLEIFEEKE